MPQEVAKGGFEILCVPAQTNTEQLPVEDNPFGNGFKGVEKELRTELQAKRVANPLVGRQWKVKNPARINPITGAPSASHQISSSR